MTTPAFDAFQKKFQISDLLITRTQYWTWSVRPEQGTLGATVISLSRPATAWSQITPEEGADLAVLVAAIEPKLQTLFGYAKINYLMLMMVDEHVHFHVFPRYLAPSQFAGVKWSDATWPKPPDLMGGESRPEVLAKIRVAFI